MIRISGSVISEFTHCPRQGWLHYFYVKTDHFSESVKIGKFYHEERHAGKADTEIELEGIKIDQIDGDTVVEYKKAKTEPEGAKMQLLFYLWKLKQKGIYKKGKIIFKENRDPLFVELSPENEQVLLERIEHIKHCLSNSVPPDTLSPTKSGACNRKCRGCSYFDFCYI